MKVAFFRVNLDDVNDSRDKDEQEEYEFDTNEDIDDFMSSHKIIEKESQFIESGDGLELYYLIVWYE